MSMLRRVLALALALLMASNLTLACAAETAQPTFEVGSAQGQPGDTGITVPIYAKNSPAVSSTKLFVTYDTTRLELTQAEINKDRENQKTYSQHIDDQPYIINWVGGTVEYTIPNSVFATLTFSIRADAPVGNADVSITYDPDDVYNLQYENINFAVQNGHITVLALPMTTASATVAAPQRGVALADTVTCGSEAYSGQVAWYEGSAVSGQAVTGNAKGNTVYTAQITLTPGEGQSFADTVAVTVNGDAVGNAVLTGGKLVVTKTFPATADKDTPTCAAPTGLTAIYGQTLADVALVNPDGNTAGTWAWEDSTQSVGSVGTNTFKATFTPADTENYATVKDIDVSVTVGAKSMKPSVTAEPAAYDYTGKAITPTKVIVKDGETVISAGEYSLSYQNNTNAGTASVTVSDVNGGNYVLTQATADFTIRQIPGAIEILDPATIVYDGSAVECGEGKDLSVAYTGDGVTTLKWYADNSGVKGSEIAAPTDAGSYWLGVSAAAGTNYKAVDEVTKRFAISPKSISGANITLDADPTYDGTEKTMTVTSVTVGNNLTATYEIVSGDKGTNAGDYTLKISGSGNFTGTAEKNWKILPASLSGAAFAPIDNQDFADRELTPKPAVTLGGKTLVEGTDFTYIYSSNRYVGNGTVNVSGKGNYTGTAATAATFTIVAVTDPAVIKGTATVTKGGNTVDLSGNVTGAVGAVSYTLKSGDGSVDTQGVYTAPAESGSAVVTVTIAASDLNEDGTDEYTAKTADVAVTITDKTVVALDVTQTGCTFGEALPAAVYTEPAGTIAITKTYTGKTRSGAAYESSTAPTDAGTYTVKVVCETATHLYEGTSGNFTIAPRPMDGAEVTLGTALTYNTQSQTQGVSTVMVGGVDILASCDVTGNTATNTGEYTLTVTAKETGNYTGSVQKAYTVSKKAITPMVDGVTALDYTGSQLTQSAVEVKDGTDVLAASDYEIVYGENITAGTDAGSLTVKAKEGGNYSFSDVTVTFTINKVAYPGATAMTSETKYGTSRTIDLTPLLAEGYELGRVSVTADADSVLDGTPAVTGTMLTFAFADAAEKTGKTATIQIPVTNATNYTPYDVTVTVTVIDKLVQTDFKFAESTKNMIYGETLDFPAIGAVTGSKVTYASSDPKVASVDETGKVTALKAGKTIITAIASATGEYAQASTSYTLQVDKATVTVKAMDRSIYVGDTVPGLTAPVKGTDYTVTGLVGEDALTGAVGMKYQLNGGDVTPDNTKAGSYDIVISGVSEPDGGNYNAIVLTSGKLTVSARPYSDGGSSSVSSGKKTETQRHEDGSVTTTVTDKKTGTVTETTKYPNGTKAIVTTEKDGAKKITAEIPTKVVETARKKNEVVQVHIPGLTPAESAEKATPVTVDLSGKNAVKVEIAVEQVTPGTVAMLVRTDGTEKLVRTSVPTENGLAFTVKPNETIKIVDNSKHFADVKDDAWYAKDVAFVSARELFNGTKDAEFSPNIAMSRGMLVTVLYRLENEPKAAQSIFTDVASGQYYTDAISWAAANGIVSGYGYGIFGPDDSITREQLAVLLWRYAGSPVSEGELDGYTDSGKISSWAVGALRWAAEQGIVTGKGGGVLDPWGQATRAEVAAMLQRYIQTAIK